MESLFNVFSAQEAELLGIIAHPTKIKNKK